VLWLLGAAEALRHAIHTQLSAAEQAEYELTRITVRQRLGPEAFAMAWNEGRAMTQEQAVAFALGQSSTAELPRRALATPPRQVFLGAGTPYEAYKTVRLLLQGARREVVLVDPYVDQTLAEQLEAVDPQVQIRVLTRMFKGDGRLALQKLAAQRSRLEVRIDASIFHDRFLKVDETFFHLGSSVKDVGIKGTMINRVEEPEEIRKLGELLALVWSGAPSAW
jgi:hypothetical protein